MKDILLWDNRFPTQPPHRLTVDDTLASAMVRSGAAAPANAADTAALNAGGPLDPSTATEIVVESGFAKRMRRVVVPVSVAAIAVSLGLGAAVAVTVAPSPTPSPTPAPTITQPSISPGSGTAGSTIFTGTDGTPANGTITAREWVLNGTVVATGGVFAPTSAQTGTLVYRNTVTGAGGTASNTSTSVNIATLFTPLSIFKAEADSRTANAGGRTVGGGTLSVSYGNGAYTMAGFIQPLCGNKWLFAEGYMHAVGATTTLAMQERAKTTSIATTGNPAFATTSFGNDAQYSSASDGLATVMTQGGNHVLSGSVSVNDGGSYFQTPNTSSQTIAILSDYADKLGAAGKIWYVGNELPRGDTAYTMEEQTVTGGTCTASNTANFIDGEAYGAVGCVGVFASGAPRPLTKVASNPGQDQYTVSSAGGYVFGGTPPTKARISYNATPSGGRKSTSIDTRVVNEWMNSNAANFVSAINGVNYGTPGLRYNRPWVRLVDTFNAMLDTSSGSLLLTRPGTMDGLQLHPNQCGSLIVGYAFKPVIDADYPSAPRMDSAPLRNNWCVARGTGVGTTFTWTLPPSMRSAFTGGPVPTLISINGVVIGKIDTTTGAITGTGITSGTHNPATGAGSITFASATSMPGNAQLWLEQDIGDYDYVNMVEGKIGRNVVMNGLLDMAVYGPDWSGTNLTTTTGTSSISTVPSTAIPYGYAFGNSAMATAVTNGTATVAVFAETDSAGFPRFAYEATGLHTAGTNLALSPNTNALNGVANRLTAGDRVLCGAQVRYAPTATNGRTYGHTGMQVSCNLGAPSISRNSSTGAQTVTILTTNTNDGGSGMYLDDSLLAIAKGPLDLYRVSPLVNTTGADFATGNNFSMQMRTAANVPFAYRVGFGRFQIRRRNDVPAT